VAAEPLNVAEYERLAEETLEPGICGYIAGGAGDEVTLRENVAAYDRWHLRPRVLVDVGAVTTATSVLGQEVSMPLLVAPTALQGLVHPDGEVAMARAGAATGTVVCLSSLAGIGCRELAQAVPECLHWFQLYWSRDRGFTRELVGALAETGFGALVLTVDFPLAGRRERDLRAGFHLPAELAMPNLPEALVGIEDFHLALSEIVDSTLTWHDLEWLRSATPLPLVIKGVLTAEDAELAVEHGASAVLVSNHGGRQLDGVAASLDALPEVVEAVGGRIEVLVDGGIRRGTDVVKALALGARAA
jgi:isopentenyl diphosphate isomerase/L-lactate dehydrogenase-like FMN-dependent dehydrogenase